MRSVDRKSIHIQFECIDDSVNPSETKTQFCIVRYMNRLRRNHIKMSILHFASRHGDIELVNYLIQTRPEYLLWMDKTGNTALHEAAYYGETAVVQAIVTAGVDVNILSKFDWKTPLSEAVQQAHIETVQCLISLGADGSILNYVGQNALEVAVQYTRNIDLIYLLISNNTPCVNIVTLILEIFASSNNPRMLNMFIEWGWSDANDKNQNDWMLL
jgi:ankyrin repeat protein